MMGAVKEHAPVLGVAPLCEALGVARATAYRTWHGERFPAKEGIAHFNTYPQS